MIILRYRYNSNLHNVMSHLSNFLSFICTHTFYDCKMCYNRETSLDVFVCTLFDVLYVLCLTFCMDFVVCTFVDDIFQEKCQNYWTLENILKPVNFSFSIIGYIHGYMAAYGFQWRMWCNCSLLQCQKVFHIIQRIKIKTLSCSFKIIGI